MDCAVEGQQSEDDSAHLIGLPQSIDKQEADLLLRATIIQAMQMPLCILQAGLLPFSPPTCVDTLVGRPIGMHISATLPPSLRRRGGEL